MISIENYLRIDRLLIVNFQPYRDFCFSIDPWLKFFKQTLIEKPVREYGSDGWLIDSWFEFSNRIVIFVFQSILDWNFSSKDRFGIFHRDRDRDWKCDLDWLDLDWNFLSGAWLKNVNRTLTFIRYVAMLDAQNACRVLRYALTGPIHRCTDQTGEMRKIWLFGKIRH